MASSVLITGGAGFIGSHLADALVERGLSVRVLDNLDSQVHGPANRPPAHVENHTSSGHVEFVQGDVRDPATVERALEGVDFVFHQAAAVGVGQSMYRIADYVSVNSLGAAALLQAIVERERPLTRMVVASSMSIYGEGSYACPEHGTISPEPRPMAQLAARDWPMRCPACQAEVEPLPTGEEKPLQPTSVYAVTKRSHEELFMTVGRAYDIPTIALRYFNVYGPRQSLSNPYTGVAAIFTCRLLNGKPPLIFEDGRQSRDFIHVSDIVQANLRALDTEVPYGVYNVGTGRRLDLLEMVRLLRERLGGPEPTIVEKFRKGDVRDCYANIARIREELGFEARVRFEDGIADLAEWARGQEARDAVEGATTELENVGLTL